MIERTLCERRYAFKINIALAIRYIHYLIGIVDSLAFQDALCVRQKRYQTIFFV